MSDNLNERLILSKKGIKSMVVLYSDMEIFD